MRVELYRSDAKNAFVTINMGSIPRIGETIRFDDDSDAGLGYLYLGTFWAASDIPEADLARLRNESKQWQWLVLNVTHYVAGSDAYVVKLEVRRVRR